MAVIRKDVLSFKCGNFAKRYPDHEANDLLREAEGLIEDMEAELEALRAARQPVGEEPADANLLRLLRGRAELPDSVELNYLRDGDGTGYAWWDRRRAELREQGYTFEFEAASGVEYFVLLGIGDEIRAALAEHDAAPGAQEVGR